MRHGDHHPGSNSAPYGAYGSGAGFRYGSDSTNAPPYRPAPAQQMTPEQKEDVLLAAGRLAAEYLVAKGELPPHVLRNRPPPPPRSFQERPHAPQHGQPLPRPFQQGGRPLAKPQFRSQQGPPRPFAPRAFQDRPPIAKRPRPQAPRPFQRRPPPPRPFPSGGHGFAPPKTGCIGQGTAQAGSLMQGGGQDEPAGDGNNRQPVPQSGGAAESPKTADQPNLL